MPFGTVVFSSVKDVDFERRYVALGDSFTEGMGDDCARRPTGVRGWADRVAEGLEAHESGWGYANLAIRGRKLLQVVEQQIEPALAMKPTLVTIYAGANDILRPRVNLDALMLRYAEAIGALRDAGAEVWMFTGFNPSASKVFSMTRGRVALYNEFVREIAHEHGAGIIDYWRMREFASVHMWGEDRTHMSTLGHTRMAHNVLKAWGITAEHTLEAPETPLQSRWQRTRANAEWAKTYLGPWISRRLRGVSSGDHLNARYPRLVSPLRLDDYL